MESWQVIKSALDRVGTKKVASRMKLSQSLVYRWAQPPGDTQQPTGSGVRNPLDRVVQLLELTEERTLIHWLCEHAGGFFVPNPLADAGGDLAVLTQTQEMIHDFSDLLEAVSEALSNDREIDKRESARIRDAWERLKRLAESFTVACEKGCYDRRKS
ncbi:MAG: hypothetical protein BIFFINMI_01679 [Phycisphaerae bacterium]|nr:hypothetical protein [Phycisphaerae bacterium]